jgi:alpha-galactosidase
MYRSVSTLLGIVLVLTSIFVTQSAAGAAGNGDNLAPTPPMGFNNWARYECGVTEAIMVRNADALVSTGLAARGYRTVTVDDCWMTHARDSSGNLVADTTKFARGLRWLGDYLHGKGLKFGIYEDAGTSTCGGFPGSLGHFQADANLFASWGVDYLKLDGCNVPVPSGKTKEQAYRDLYAEQSTALANSGRAIVFSESAPAYFCCATNSTWFSVLSWLPQYGQLWREGFDIAVHDTSGSRWGSVVTNYRYNVPLSRYAGPNHWNDPDFLITGDTGLTAEEYRSQVSLWSMMAAPLILSTDVAAIDATAVAAAGNTNLIAVDQDSLGRQAGIVSQNGSVDILSRPLSNGDRAVALFNQGAGSTTVSTTAAAIGFPGGTGCSFTLKDLWSNATSSTSGTISASVPSHGTVVFRVTPAAGCGAQQPTGQVTGTSGKCLDNSASGTADGNPIILWPCSGNANQRFTVPGNGSLRVQGRCAGANGTGNGAQVQLFTCNGGAAQQWQYRADGTLLNPQSGRCLDITGGGSADGTKLELWTCGANQTNQLFALPV